MPRFALTSALIGAAVLFQAPSASAANLPAIKASGDNAVPACVTPGRLTAFIEGRNKKFDPRFREVAAEYAKHGRDLGLRWDIAFFQMMVETGNLSFGGDVQPDQNNFAGLGATGGGERGESFPDISTGVLAHLQHVQLYSGEKVENPVAERTRKVQDWGVVEKWYKNVKGERTYSDLAKQWAPGSSRYPKDIAAIASAFMSGPCLQPDPAGDTPLAAREAPPEPSTETAAKEPAAEPPPSAAVEADTGPAPELTEAQPSPEQTAPQTTAAIDPKPSDKEGKRPQTTAAVNAKPGENEGKTEPKPEPSIADKMAGPPPDLKKSSPDPKKNEGEKAAGNNEPGEQVAAAGQAAQAPPEASATAPCRVWTASYGGSKAIIIKATLDKTVNYTVLDVNEGKEKREAEAYIAAYAKGGEAVGEFPNQAQALDKAFELCPEG